MSGEAAQSCGTLAILAHELGTSELHDDLLDGACQVVEREKVVRLLPTEDEGCFYKCTTWLDRVRSRDQINIGTTVEEAREGDGLLAGPGRFGGFALCAGVRQFGLHLRAR